MPVYNDYGISDIKRKNRMRKETIQYWTNKGCSESKAEKLFYRYGYK